jgi:DNA invertase Pin-like site-specific DNA recombinase
MTWPEVRQPSRSRWCGQTTACDAPQRTRDALKAAKARGAPLGNPRLDEVRARAVASLKADADRFAANVAPIIREIQASGVASHRGIARSLNARGVATARRGQWTAVQVSSVLRRAA